MHSTELELVHELIEHNRHARQGGIAERRQIYDRAQVAFGALGVERGKTVDAGGCSAEWVRPVVNGGSVVLYLHGGAFALGSVESHRHLSAAVGAAADAGVLALDYSRPPEHPFPAAVDDAVAAYHWLRNQGVRHDRIALAGDSAGAGLALSTVLRLRAEGSPLPAAVAAMSPWADLSCSGASHRERLARDPLLDPADLRRMADLYLAGADARDPIASPVFGNLAGLPPILIQVGSEEVLWDDAVALATAACTAGVPTLFEPWDGMFHVWQWYEPILPEGRRAVSSLGTFVAEAVRRTGTTGTETTS